MQKEENRGKNLCEGYISPVCESCHEFFPMPSYFSDPTFLGFAVVGVRLLEVDLLAIGGLLVQQLGHQVART
jgi:hypothetical protein